MGFNLLFEVEALEIQVLVNLHHCSVVGADDLHPLREDLLECDDLVFQIV